MGGAEVRVDELVELASKWATACKLTGNEDCTSERLARGVLDLLGEAQPCGWDEPTVDRGLSPVGILLPYQWGALVLSPIAAITPEDARHMARLLLRAADLADASAAEGTGE
jgi:hypothetical protein